MIARLPFYFVFYFGFALLINLKPKEKISLLNFSSAMASKRKLAGPSVCRYCSTACTRDISSVYLYKGHKEVYSEMLSETFKLNIAYSESMYEEISHLICKICISRLRDAVEFRKKVYECELALQEFLHQSEQSNNTELDIIEVKAVEDMASEDIMKDIKEEGESLEEMESLEEPEVLEDMDNLEEPEILVEADSLEEPENLVEAPADEEHMTDCEDEPCEQPDVRIPKEEPVEDSAPLAKKRRRARKSKLKRPKKKDEMEDSSEAASRSASKDGSGADELSVESPAAAIINAKVILKFTTVYPFKVTRLQTIRCSYCEEIFEFKQADHYRTHVDTAHTYLDKTIAISSSTYARLTRVDVSDLSCRICSETFQTIETTAMHLKKEHALTINLNESLGLVPIKLDSDRFECLVCGCEFDGFLQLSKHTASHFAVHICHVCGKKTETKICHCQSSQSDRVSCVGCKQSFPSLDARKLHHKISKNCLPYKCRDCGDSFASYEVRQRHFVESHGRAQLIFSCTKCELTFPYRALLTRHFNSTHTDLYKCHYCNKRLWSNVTLACHIARVHTLEKAYKCPFCECSYFEKHLMKIHMRIHDDNKKFHCKVCERMFVRRYRLRDHMVKSHPGVSMEDI